MSSPETCAPPFGAMALMPVKKTTVGVPPSGADGEAAANTKWELPWMPPHTRPAVHNGAATGQWPCPGGMAEVWKLPTTGLHTGAGGADETQKGSAAITDTMLGNGLSMFGPFGWSGGALLHSTGRKWFFATHLATSLPSSEPTIVELRKCMPPQTRPLRESCTRSSVLS